MKEFSEVFSDKSRVTKVEPLKIMLATSEDETLSGATAAPETLPPWRLREMENLGVIKRSDSPCYNPMVIIHKKDDGVRICEGLKERRCSDSGRCRTYVGPAGSILQAFKLNFFFSRYCSIQSQGKSQLLAHLKAFTTMDPCPLAMLILHQSSVSR